MNHPVIMSANAQVRYAELLQAAEAHRRVKRLKRSDFGRYARILSSLGDALIALGGWVKMQGATDAKASV